MRSRFSSRVMVVHLVVLSLDCFQRHLVTRDALYLRVLQVFDTLSFVCIRQAAAPTNNSGRIHNVAKTNFKGIDFRSISQE